jgi:Domain of unknown function (DUF4124)
MNKKLLLLLSTALALPVSADIYKFVDEYGHVTYSNQPAKGGKKLDLPSLPTVPAVKGQVATPANFPKVDNKTQRERDDVRRKILEEELTQEAKALADAQQALGDGEAVRLGDERNYQKYLDRVQGLKDSVEQHEKNVNAIKQELSALR